MIREFYPKDLSTVVDVWLLSGKDEYSYQKTLRAAGMVSVTRLLKLTF